MEAGSARVCRHDLVHLARPRRPRHGPRGAHRHQGPRHAPGRPHPTHGSGPDRAGAGGPALPLPRLSGAYGRLRSGALSFPLYLEVAGLRLHPHAVFELLAYFVGFRLYLRDRRRQGDLLDAPRRWWVVAAAAAGAALGARVLALLECPAELWSGGDFPLERLAGKSIVGAIAGGWLAVEGAKRLGGIESRTGDLLAIPLAAAIALGRIGCLLTGAGDRTFGDATTLPLAFDFGDGVRRLPMPLFETIFLLILVVTLARWRVRSPVQGDLFRGFVAAYFSWRLVVDFAKHADCRWLGLSTIQWVTVLGLSVVVPDLRRWLMAARPSTSENSS